MTVSTKKRKRVLPFDERLRDLQQEVLVAVASGAALPDVMRLLCRKAEGIATNAVCSVIRVDAEGRLRPLAAPSLPAAYSHSIDGLPIGPMVGSCGTAAYWGEPVEVTNIKTDPRWRDFKDAALGLGLKACWSYPIKSHDNRVIGTFAFYFRTPRRASPLEKRIVDLCVHVCCLAIGQWEAQDRIRRLAFSDPLTGLGNRAHLAEQFPRIIARAEQSEGRAAVIYVDINGFRILNEAQGHKNGDSLLCSVASRIRRVCGEDDVIVRLGSDEFLIVCEIGADVAEIEKLAGALSAALAKPHTLDGGAEVRAVASIGIACFPDDGRDLQALMGHADTALRRVRERGSAGFAIYTARMDAEKLARRALERDVSIAATMGQLTLAYQPQANASTGAIEGFEALVRWNHPIHGFVSPDVFIPAAEACGAIVEIGAYVLKEALAQAVKWPGHLRIAVNASPAQIVHADFAQLVEDTIEATGIDPTRVEIEVTESLFIYDTPAALKTLERLKAMGVSVAMDDFGTGYSSLSTLQSFRFDRIKIDRSFIMSMTANPDAAAIVTSILGLGRALGRPVVAEGVETSEQLELLREQGCAEVQGYLIGKPKPIEHYAELTARAPVRKPRRATPARPRAGRQPLAPNTATRLRPADLAS